MKEKRKITFAIFVIISIFAITFPIGFLLNIIEAKVAFPMVFALLGVQQLINGIFISSKNNEKVDYFSTIFGIGFILFALIIVMPYYYL